MEFTVLVIGAGVSGLTTAVCLAENNFDVQIIAKDPPLRTTSAAAGANWGPYRATDSRIDAWSNITRKELTGIAAASSESGVRLVRGLEVEAVVTSPPRWATRVPDFELAQTVPDGYQTGWWFTAPVVDMRRYLPYLQGRLADRGVEIVPGTVDSLRDLIGAADIIVNCTGAGSRELVDDQLVYPVRGQLVVVPNPGIDYFFQDSLDHEETTYFMPQGDRVVLGGCAIPHDENLEPDAEIARQIIERCAAIEPRLRGLEILEIRTGLRPARSRVRLELDWLDRQAVIHNYGHGGAGVTLSWGCSSSVLSYARGLAKQRSM
jgi:D-amino-acid oxidase